MLIFGLDIATKTGMAIYDTDQSENRIICETLLATGSSGEHRAWNVGRLLKNRIGHHGIPDLVIVEAAPRTAMKNVATQNMISMLHGSYLGILVNTSIPPGVSLILIVMAYTLGSLLTFRKAFMLCR